MYQVEVVLESCLERGCVLRGGCARVLSVERLCAT